MLPHLVLAVSPVGDLLAHLVRCLQPMLVQEPIPDVPVEVLNVAVHRDVQRLVAEVISHGQALQALAVRDDFNARSVSS